MSQSAAKAVYLTSLSSAAAAAAAAVHLFCLSGLRSRLQVLLITAAAPQSGRPPKALRTTAAIATRGQSVCSTGTLNQTLILTGISSHDYLLFSLPVHCRTRFSAPSEEAAAAHSFTHTSCKWLSCLLFDYYYCLLSKSSSVCDPTNLTLNLVPVIALLQFEKL